MKSNLKLFVGITAPQSVDLLNGQLNYFYKKGYDVSLLAPKTKQVEDFCTREGVTLIPITIKRSFHPLYDIMSLFQLLWVLWKERPDIVNLGTPKVSFLGMIAAKIVGIPQRIYTCRGFRFEHEQGAVRRLLISMERITALCAHKVVCISLSIKEMGIRERIFEETKTIHVGKGSSNGINLSLFDPDKICSHDQQLLKDQYGLNGGFVFGFVGRLVDRKGINELFTAFSNVYREDPMVKLLVVGRPYWDQIKDKAIIDEYHRHPGIVMTGLQPPETIPLFLSIMDAFVLPAWWEGFGNVLIQAAAMGVPIISTRSTGCKDAVADEFNGKLVEPFSPEKFENEMRYFYGHREEIRQYGKNGRLWARNFHPEIIWTGLEKVYQS